MLQKKTVTGVIALDYLKTVLGRGGKLSSYIGRLPLIQGEISAFVPLSTTDETLYKFEYGGIYHYEPCAENEYVVPIKNNAKPLVIKEIQSYLMSDEANCCLFEDALSSPSDGWLLHKPLEYVHLDNNDMFYFFDNRRNDYNEIENALTKSTSHVFLCALSSLNQPSRSELSERKEISLDLLEQFASKVVRFFLMAYDYEGYLMWSLSNEEMAS